MPRKIIVSEGMEQVVRRALNTPRGIKISFDAPGQAINFRQKFYAMRKRVLAHDTNSEWRTLSARAVENVLYLEPADMFVMRLEIEEITEEEASKTTLGEMQGNGPADPTS